MIILARIIIIDFFTTIHKQKWSLINDHPANPANPQI